MWRWLPGALLAVQLASAADSKWIQSKTGTLEVLSDAGNKAALEKLGFFEQFRFALGTLVGKPELVADPPIRLLVAKNPSLPPALMPGRDHCTIPLAADRPIPASVLREATRTLLAANVARLPPDIEKGLEKFFSTLDVRGAHVVWGEPPAPSERSREWARIQLLATKPDYYGKLKILLFNLQKGIADDPAFRNAIGKSKKEFDLELEAYLKAGVYASSDGPGKPLNAQRDLTVKPLDTSDILLATADLLTPESRSQYLQLIQEKKHIAEANEGLGLLALRDKKEADALQYFTAATEADSKSPSAWLAYAKLETDRPRSNEAIEHALDLNPKLAEGHYLLGARKHDLDELKKATALKPGEWEYWNSLAEVYLDANQFPEAAKAYRAAEQAAADPADQERMHRAWSRIETEKLDYQDSEKRRVSDDQQRELQRLKDKAVADLHASEAKINQRLGGTAPDHVLSWEEAGLPVMLEGTLRQVDCLGKSTRLVIEGPEKKPVKLALKDRGRLACGLQKDRHVSVEYTPKPDAQLGTVGEVASLPDVIEP